MTNNYLNKAGDTLSEEKGYTLTELLIVMSVAGFLGVMTLTIWLFGQGYLEQWSRNVQVVNKVHVLVTGISEELYRAKGIHEIEKNQLTLLFDGDSLRVYEVKDGKLLRNNRVVPTGVIEIVCLGFQRIEKLRNTEAGSEEKRQSVFAVEIDLMVALRGDTISASRVVVPRKPFMWDRMD